jgi:hypothetical protein
LDFARLVAGGEWCHIFPEAGVWQKSTLGGRGSISNRQGDKKSAQAEAGAEVASTGDAQASSSNSETIGKLKWGKTSNNITLLHYIASHRIASHRIASHRITSYHIR